MAPGENVTATRLTEFRKSDAPEHRRELRALADYFVAEYEFQDCDWNSVPGPHCFDKKPERRKVVVHNFGAIQCLERLTELLDPSGWILINDYGSAESEREDDWFEHQRYSGATFVGVNFDELKRHFQNDSYRFAEPADEDNHMFARLLGGPGLPSELVAKFKSLFSKQTIEERKKLKGKATALLSHQRYEGALSVYRGILEEQPYDWISLGKVAELLAFGLGDPAAGLSAIREGLALNPSCSSLLWDIAGDCLLELGQPYEARKAFVRAIELNPEDVRSRFGLASVHVRARDWSAALETIAEGLACSRDQQWTQQLLAKQVEVLTELNQSHRNANRRLANRIRQASDVSSSQVSRAQ